jgi:iron complex outermembrane receptor protein
MGRRLAWALALGAPLVVHAQTAPEGEDAIVVSASRVEQRRFDAPASIDLIPASVLQRGQPMINLSESLPRVPGIVVQNRQNYAQDLQISVRGFGARSAFGVRGVRLIVDGIPATMPDGQGQAATIALDSAKRIEVLRGPFANLYGNAAGGVIQAFTADGPELPTFSGGLTLGSYRTAKIDIQAGGQEGRLNYLFDVSRLHSHGYRDHSTVAREHLNGKLRYDLDPATTVTVLVNSFAQPDTLDPLGLTRAQVEQNPKQADPSATAFNTRKSIGQNQFGLTLQQRRDAGTLDLRAYAGDRQVTQYQALSGAAITSSGGVVDLDRGYHGFGAKYSRRTEAASRPLSLSIGLDYDMMNEHRRGFVNNTGNAGALRRDEDDRVDNLDLYAQFQWRFADLFSLAGGLRASRVTFRSNDHFIVTGNPDDSGTAAFSSVNPVIGLTAHLRDDLNVYANLGRGFETPTFAELAYRASGTGLNFGLLPGRSRHAEVGIKWRIAERQSLDVALFDVATRDEIVVNSATGGRTNFKNAGRTGRNGAEIAYLAELGRGFGTHVAYTRLSARFRDAFTSGTPAVAVPSGNFLPGVPDATLFAELSWKHAPSGFTTAAEARHAGRVFVDDRNSDAAAAYTVYNWFGGFEQRGRNWKLTEFIRVDNLADRRYLGSVIVADSNSRFFEPAPGRSLLLGARASLSF